MNVILKNFRTQHVRFGNGASPEVFDIKATINTTRGIQFSSQGQDVYVPDPNNPESVLPRQHRKTGISATITGSGTCSQSDLSYFTGLLKSNTSVNVQCWQEDLGYWPMAVKVTSLKVDADPPKGDDATFDVTLESDGALGDYVDASGLQTYQSLARALGTGASETLDFNGGGLLDVDGQAINFTEITSLEIRAAATNTTNLTVGAATHPFLGPLGTGETLTLHPGQSIVWNSPTTPWTVTPGSNDQIQVANAAGATANYDIIATGS